MRRTIFLILVSSTIAISIVFFANTSMSEERLDLDQKISQMENALHWHQNVIIDNSYAEIYKEYKILKHSGVYYGIDPKDSSVDIKNIVAQAKFLWVSAMSLGEVKEKIDEILLYKNLEGKAPSRSLGSNTQRKVEPVLVELNYKSYNIVKYKDFYYGVSQREGALDIRDIETLKTKEPWFSDMSLAIVKSKIDKEYQKLPLSARVRVKIRSIVGVFLF